MWLKSIYSQWVWTLQCQWLQVSTKIQSKFLLSLSTACSCFITLFGGFMVPFSSASRFFGRFTALSCSQVSSPGPWPMVPYFFPSERAIWFFSVLHIKWEVWVQLVWAWADSKAAHVSGMTHRNTQLSARAIQGLLMGMCWTFREMHPPLPHNWQDVSFLSKEGSIINSWLGEKN